MRNFLLVCILLFITVVPQTAAQEDTTIIAQPQSGRYQLSIPNDWVVQTNEIRGLSGTFLGEIVTIADSPEALRSLGNNNAASPTLGKTLVANIFPTVSATRGQPITDPNEIFRLILRDDADTAQFFDVNGLPAVRTTNYPGPPYENSFHAGLTMILDADLIYFLVYGAQDNAGLAEVANIAASLVVNSVDNTTLLNPDMLGTRDDFSTNDGQLNIPMGEGWLVVSSGPSGSSPVQSFMIIPEPHSTLNFALGNGAGDALPGLVIQVQSQPYDLLFGSADYQTTADDRAFVLGQSLAPTGGEPIAGAEELTLAGVPAMQIDIQQVFGGNNTGTIILLDSNFVVYTITFVGATSEWESQYLPLVSAIIEGLSVTSNTTIAADGSNVPVGAQTGLLAPEFTTTLLDGTPTALSEYRGKVVLLNFWATWCGPCRVEMPAFQEIFSTSNPDDFVVLAVNLMENTDTIQTYADELGLSFPIALDPNGEINELFNVSAYPSTYVLDRDGVIRVTHAGPVNEIQVLEWIEIASN